MIRELHSGSHRFAAGASRVVSFVADEVTPTALTMPARVRAQEVAHHLATLFGRRFTALALPPAQFGTRRLSERLRITEAGEELLSLRSLLAYRAGIGALEDGERGELTELVARLEADGLLARARYGNGDGDAGSNRDGAGLVLVGALGTASRIGAHLPGSIVTNANFFVILPEEADSFHTPLGQPVGLTARQGVISRPPTARRSSLLRTKQGWSIREVGSQELRVILPGGRELRGGAKGGAIFTRGPHLPGARTPADPAALDVTLIGRWAAGIARGGEQTVPHGGLVIRTDPSRDAVAIDELRLGKPVRYVLGGVEDLVTAVQVGPRLVAAGAVCVGERSFREEEFYLSGSAEPTIPTLFPADADETAAARLAVGVRSDGRLLVVAVEGRSSLDRRRSTDGRGCTLSELAELLVAAGARDALNLDGGGSVQVVSGRESLIRPADARGVSGGSFERPIPTALAFA